MTKRRIFLIGSMLLVVTLTISYRLFFHSNLILVIDNYSWNEVPINVEVWIDDDLIVDQKINRDKTGHRPEIFPTRVDSDKSHNLRVSLSKLTENSIEFTVDRKTYLIIQIDSDSSSVFQSNVSVVNFEEALKKGLMFKW
jgi:hypothetical protein